MGHPLVAGADEVCTEDAGVRAQGEGGGARRHRRRAPEEADRDAVVVRPVDQQRQDLLLAQHAQKLHRV